MRVLAVDYGDARTGLAVCDAGELLASPAGVIPSRDRKKALAETAAAARRLGAERIVVGHPLNMDGSAGERARICRDFAGELEEASGLPVVLWDERGSTVTAARYLSDSETWGKKRKAVIDAVAAVVILESYLAWRKNHPGE